MKVVLIGDTLLNQETLSIDNKLLEQCQDADLVLLNVEGPLTTAAAKKSAGTPICSRPENIRYLQQLNVHVAILGNNHIMDHGIEGLTETCDILKAHSIDYVGASSAEQDRPWVIEKEKVAIFSYTHQEGPMYDSEGFGPISLPPIEELLREIDAYKQDGYKIIFNYHGGEEFFSVPWPRRRGFLRRISDQGVDIIFAHHSHSIQPLEIRDGKVVIYSPGNFYMDTPYQRKHEQTKEGYVTVIDEQNVTTLSLAIDLDKKEVSVSGEKVIRRDQNRELNEKQVEGIWRKECKSKFSQPFKRSFPLSRSKLVIRLLRYAIFIKKIKKLDRKERDLDILWSSLPLIGRRYVKKLFSKGYTNYRF
ncbi:CapA family protein [Bacillus sp. FJAT-45037]|uniref:CapA family protein n=1 Tax=Bacillus sp. FJAT-45037 TaxID=2011007 RepID=UPI000C2348AA|nr:CapA family protein [Bacillus sp. FJAT-45037]